jgi:hypothetical protein
MKINSFPFFNFQITRILIFLWVSYFTFSNEAFCQIKIFPDGNTTVGTLTQFQSQTKLQILAGAGPTDPIGLWINCLNHTNNYAYCQTNNVNKPLSKAFEVQLNGVTKYYIKGDGGTVFTSDSILKTNLNRISNSIEILSNLNGYTYQFKDELAVDHKIRSGLIAQEVERILPHLVDTDQNNIKGVNYVELIPYLLDAIKELNAKIEELEVKLDNCCKN